MQPTLFLSHSSRDKAFARKLDAALSRCGVEVFLDERAILVGQSIPQRIHEGIVAATHFVLVISSASNSSAWVREELDAAKMRALSSTDCLVLPVRIEDVAVPIQVQHLKYADFLNWDEERAFRDSLALLLRSLGVSRPVLPARSIGFLLQNSALALAASLAAARIEYMASGLLTMALHGVSSLPRAEALPGASWTLRYFLLPSEDNPLLPVAKFRAAMIADPRGSDEALSTMIALAERLLSLEIRFPDAKSFLEFRDAAFRLSSVIQSNLHDAIATTFAGYEPQPATHNYRSPTSAASAFE